jgi:hypothetical protein
VEDKAKLERMLRKLDHYKTRFLEHKRAIKFAKERRAII